MKRIDTVNARPDVNGVGKVGFHDNADVSGQDATYLSPDWCNHVQEEIANVIEKNGHALNPASKQQLYEILATEEGLLALADSVQQSLDGKYDKTGGLISGSVVIDSSYSLDAHVLSGAIDAIKGVAAQFNLATLSYIQFQHIPDALFPATAGEMHINSSSNVDFYEFDKPIHAPSFVGGNVSIAANGYTSLPNGLILQWGKHENNTAVNTHVTFPIAFPTACLNISATAENTNGARAEIVNFYNVNTTGFDWTGASGSGGVAQAVVHGHWLAIGY